MGSNLRKRFFNDDFLLETLRQGSSERQKKLLQLIFARSGTLVVIIVLALSFFLDEMLPFGSPMSSTNHSLITIMFVLFVANYCYLDLLIKIIKSYEKTD